MSSSPLAAPRAGTPAIPGDRHPDRHPRALPLRRPWCGHAAGQGLPSLRGASLLPLILGGGLLGGLAGAPLRAAPLTAETAGVAQAAAPAARATPLASETGGAEPPQQVPVPATPGQPPQSGQVPAPQAPPPLGAAALLGEEPLVIGGERPPAAGTAPLGPESLSPGAPTLPGAGGAGSRERASSAEGRQGSAADPVAPPAAATAQPAPADPAATTTPGGTAATPAASGSGQAPPAGDAPATTVPPPPQRLLVLERSRRRLRLLENGRELRAFPVAVGMAGWETPVGSFQVLNKVTNPVWEHPQTGRHVPSGPDNPLGSRWIGFHRDCQGRRGWDGDQMLDVQGCVLAGFHGTPHRWTVGRAVSHGCVRLYEEHVREVFDFVSIGTPVTVLP